MGYAAAILSWMPFWSAEVTAPHEVVAYQGRSVKIVIPERPLALGSVQIVPNSKAHNFVEWDLEAKREAHALIQRVVQTWGRQGTTHYLIYGRNTDHAEFSWEIVPYPQKGWWFWKQFKVLWNITFGSFPVSQKTRQLLAQDFIDLKPALPTPPVDAPSNDPFCSKTQVGKQLVFEGSTVNVLYNLAPTEELDFLIVPKRHVFQFSALSSEEYLETMGIAQTLISHYKMQGCPTAFLFDKTGKEAGQTVLHWHEHLVLTASKAQEFLGKLMVLKNMSMGSSRLSEQKLQEKVASLRQEFSRILTKKQTA